MSVAEGPPSGGGTFDAFPTFGLGYLFDDPDDPEAVTVFSTADGDDITAAWITVDVEHAVPIEDVR